MYYLAWVAMTKYHRLVSHTRHLFSHNSGGSKSKIRVSSFWEPGAKEWFQTSALCKGSLVREQHEESHCVMEKRGVFEK